MIEKKEYPFTLLNILELYSDRNHILSARDIQQRMEEKSGVRLNRRTLYANLDMLKRLGFPISDWNENGKGYYLRNRTFEPQEVSMLCSLVEKEPSFPPETKRRLREKLQSFLNFYEKENADRSA